MVSFHSGPLRFGAFELNPSTGELRRHGLQVRVTRQAMTLLCLLVEEPSKIRTREEIQKRLWPDHTFVDFEHSLNKVVHSLREALDDSAFNPRFIETVATQGYRFLPQFVEQGGTEAIRTCTDGGASYLAVLPIEANDDADLIFLAGRIASLLTDVLSVMDGVNVIAESTVKSCRLSSTDPQRAGVRLGVASVLAGDLSRYNGSIYLHMELIDVCDGRLLYGAQAEIAAEAGLRCESEFVREILRQMSPVLMNLSRKPMLLSRRGKPGIVAGLPAPIATDSGQKG